MGKREIKFRAWNPAMNQMIEPEMLFIIDESDDGTCSLFTTVKNLQENFELMQFTGLLDKNGKEIYEGDIVNENIEDFGDQREINIPVTFNAGAFYPVCMQPSTTFEVIGNIYEHPSLLSVENDGKII